MINAKVEFTSNAIEVTAKVAYFSDVKMGLMASAIEAKMKTGGEVPFLPVSTKTAQRGALRTSIRSQKMMVGMYKVTAGENSPAGAYAAAQEAGTVRGYPIKNYSTPGTGPHWFEH